MDAGANDPGRLVAAGPDPDEGVGERALAEEIFQDTMLAIWRSACSLRGECQVRTWVIAIARRQARDRLRRRQLMVVSDTQLADLPSSGPGARGCRVRTG